MKRPRFLIALLAFAIGISGGDAVRAQKEPAPAEKKKSAIPEGYHRTEIGLFVVYIQDEVLEQQRKSTLAIKPMKALTQELNILYTQLGENVLTRVQKEVKIWVEWRLQDPKIPKNAIAYYYSKDP